MWTHTSTFWYFPLIAFAAYVGWNRLERVHVGTAIAYWIASPTNKKNRTDSLVIRYLDCVYSAGPFARPLKRILLFSGLLGVFLEVSTLSVLAWNAIHGQPGDQIPIIATLAMAAACYLAPHLVLAGSRRWRLPLVQRRKAAIVRLFGGQESATAFAQTLLARYPGVGRPTLWAFPMDKTGWWQRFSGAPVWFFLSILAAVALRASNASGLVFGALLAAVLLFAPLNLAALYIAFGNWTTKSQAAMIYPVSIFLSDVRF